MDAIIGTNEQKIDLKRVAAMERELRYYRTNKQIANGYKLRTRRVPYMILPNNEEDSS